MGMARRAGRIRVKLAALPPLEHLQSLWLELESRAEPSFFQSWAWIGPWLRLICPARIARLLTVSGDGRLLGIGVLTTRRRFLGLGPRHLRLHETGDSALDDLTIEYNGLLAEKGLEREVLAATVSYLARAHPRWLTLNLPGIAIDDALLARLRGIGLETRLRKSDTHHVDLAALRSAGSAYLPALRSANTRSTLRRTARRLAGRHGAVRLVAARGARERLAFFRDMVALHQVHWTGSGNGRGAFADPRILRFHERLITESGEDAGAQLLRLDAGDATVGYAYNLVRRGTVYFYQAGIDYARFGDCGSPGLLLLGEAIQWALERGHDRFELMAGDGRFKRSLGMARGEMAWLSLDRRGWHSRLRKAWRSLRGSAPA
ncbi:hypothetical protein GCM10027084_21660 [Pseudoxanthomonas sangjuensis]|nr:hypothetical protein CSC71_02580 [Pseudoxanthomonas sangjuensis]